MCRTKMSLSGQTAGEKPAEGGPSGEAGGCQDAQACHDIK